MCVRGRGGWSARKPRSVTSRRHSRPTPRAVVAFLAEKIKDTVLENHNLAIHSDLKKNVNPFSLIKIISCHRAINIYNQIRYFLD